MDSPQKTAMVCGKENTLSVIFFNVFKFAVCMRQYITYIAQAVPAGQYILYSPLLSWSPSPTVMGTYRSKNI